MSMVLCISASSNGLLILMPNDAEENCLHARIVP